ncbi:hypothetical protein CPT_Muldoon_215 [Serratia phage Muldoon]|uniref:Uncharacterized protein n=1 Tax=Serratia phage Muldoon TaxID=2601678 RepID=A0A5P8PHI1_9CAUD|nr:hypothetical protein HYP94_gp175 [Serratia phage Muldoon]QFR56166.1 hypothetical protein CPT_Muldoon_215 [Serratia phage Muldoon]
MILNQTQTTRLRKTLYAILSEGFHDVQFVKSDNTIRTMKATRDEEFVGNAFSGGRTASLEAIKVYDLDEADYRTFRIDSLITINGIDISTLLKLVNA